MISDKPLPAREKYILLQNARHKSILMIARIDNFTYVFVIRRKSVFLTVEPAPRNNPGLFAER
jgi:hypothetical protein